jgi:hypothetical protein
MVATEDGMLIVARLVQPLNAAIPIVVREEDASNVTAVKVVCPENMPSDIVTAVGPNVTEETVHPVNRVDVAVGQFNVICRALQPLNIFSPKVITDAGINMLVRLVQPLNAESPMVVNCDVGDRITLARAEQPLNARALIVVIVSGMVTDVIRVWPV